MRLFLLPLLLATFLSILPLDKAFAKSKLSKIEVQEQFIGIPWHGPKGVFLFREDGTYTYKDFTNAKPRGTWPYEFLEDGTLKGAFTSYTFFRRKNGKYIYYHSKTRKYYKAIPNRTAPFK